MIYTIREWPDKVLTRKASLVDVEDTETNKELVNNLFCTMQTNNGIGLAATQCGIGKRVFVMDTTSIHCAGLQHHFVNPIILESSGNIMYQEGCLSFPGVYAEVNRHQTVLLKYWDVDLEQYVESEFSGIESICIQHELDHLEGIVFVDYFSPVKRKMLLKKLTKRKKRDKKIY